MKAGRVLLRALLATLCLSLSSGCALWDEFFGKPDKPPEQMMSEGLRDLNRGRYTAATEAFQAIRDRYPYSKYAVEAELRLGDALYKRDMLEEAYEAYNDFERLHPKNPETPYVLYRKGMCHFQQIKTIDRDQSHTLQAKEEFERVVRRFPRSEYAGWARRKIRACYMKLAEYELYVGHFYFKKKKYRAAMERYRYILQNYPDLGQYHEALEYLNRCREKLAARGEPS